MNAVRSISDFLPKALGNMICALGSAAVAATAGWRGAARAFRWLRWVCGPWCVGGMVEGEGLLGAQLMMHHPDNQLAQKFVLVAKPQGEW